MLLDWQMVGMGKVVWEINYCLSGSLEPNKDTYVEAVRHYHAEMTALGVTKYTFEELMRQVNMKW
jgi:hypothetical protein